MIAEARWLRMWEVFHEALDRPLDDRAAFVCDSCGDDKDLRREVESLLLSHEIAEGCTAMNPDGQFIPDGAKPPSEAAVPSLEGRQVGRYTIGRLIGTGGSGAVYEARQHDPPKTVALKVIRAGLADARAIRRFEFEAEMLARLHHPSIAQVFEAGTFDLGAPASPGGRHPYFAMEFIDGLPITLFADREKLNLRQRVELMIEVCRAVHHAHQRGVIHRDLKPGNILVEIESGCPRPKVLDFGVARLSGGDGDISATLSRQFAEVAGTLPYMSPEHFAGGVRGIDAQADVYSLGVVCYELLTHRLPLEFTSRSIFDAAWIIREQSPTPPATHDARLRGDLQTIILKALEKNPEQRYISADDLAADLQRYLNCEPIAARPPTRRYRLARLVQRHKGLAAGVCAAVLVLVLGTIISMWQAVRATAAERRAHERFQDVRSLAKTVIFDLEKSIANLPGSTPARRLLVESGLSYLDRISHLATDDAALLRELAESYERLANVQGFPRSANLGDYSGAIANFERSVELWGRLNSLGTVGDEAPYRLAQARGQLAETLSWQGEHDRALALYDADRQAMLALGRENPVDYRAMFWFTCAARSAVMTMGRVKPASDNAVLLDAADSACQTLRKVWTLSPSNPQQHNECGMALLGLAMTHLHAQDAHEALSELDACEPHLRVAAMEIIDEPDPILNYGDVFRHRGSAYMMLNEPHIAAESFRLARNQYEKALGRAPDEYRIHQVICLTRQYLAEALIGARNHGAALAEVEEAVSAVERHLAADPANVFRLRSVLLMREGHAAVVHRIASDGAVTAENRTKLLNQARLSLERCVELAQQATRSVAFSPLDLERLSRINERLTQCTAEPDEGSSAVSRTGSD